MPRRDCCDTLEGTSHRIGCEHRPEPILSDRKPEVRGTTAAELAGSIHKAFRIEENVTWNSFADFINQHLDRELKEEEMDSAVGQLQVFMEALGIFTVRNKKYRDLWRKAGWLSHIHHIRHKAARLMNSFWGQKDVPAEGADLDDAYDLINYTAFFIRSYHEGNERGTLW